MKMIHKVILVASGRSRCTGRQKTFGRGKMSQTAKVLLLYAHPESQDSVANRVLLEPALQLSNVTCPLYTSDAADDGESVG
ncbi:hypothetical protein CWN68_06895, partial [Klebsiella michiganensis]